MNKKARILGIIFLFFIFLVYYIINNDNNYERFVNSNISPVSDISSVSDTSEIKVAVIYDGSSEELYWKDTYSQLEQSIMLNFSVKAIDITKSYNLNDFDIIYPDKFIMQSKYSNNIKNKIISFVKNGGSVFLDNSFYSFFPKEFIGAKKYKKIEGIPKNLKSSNSDDDLNEIKEIIIDFAKLYEGYYDNQRLSNYDYGYAIEPSTAKTLISNDIGSLYTLNEYGQGNVFFTNPLLPNIYSLNGFSLETRDEN